MGWVNKDCACVRVHALDARAWGQSGCRGGSVACTAAVGGDRAEAHVLDALLCWWCCAGWASPARLHPASPQRDRFCPRAWLALHLPAPSHLSPATLLPRHAPGGRLHGGTQHAGQVSAWQKQVPMCGGACTLPPDACTFRMWAACPAQPAPAGGGDRLAGRHPAHCGPPFCLSTQEVGTHSGVAAAMGPAHLRHGLGHALGHPAYR